MIIRPYRDKTNRMLCNIIGSYTTNKRKIMKKVFCLFIFLFLFIFAAPVYALTSEEILLLKKSGVSDEKISEMQKKEEDRSPQPISSTETQKKDAAEKPEEKAGEKAEKEIENAAEKGAEKKAEGDSAKKPQEEEEKKIALTVNIKAAYEKWTAAKKRYKYGCELITNKCKYSVKDILGEGESEFGLLLGPEINFYLFKYFFLRGSYLYGENDFLKIGKGRREKTAFDVGIGETGGIFLGYRNMGISFLNWNNVNMTADSISDAVIGVFLRTNPYKSGFKVNFDLACGFAVFGNALSSDDNKYKEGTVVIEAELDMGYRFKRIPLGFNIGYGGWMYDKVVQGSPLVRYENWGHGANLKLSYTF